MKSICVFAGSAKGVRESYSKSAKDLGLEIAKREFSMVYGCLLYSYDAADEA